MNKIPMLTVGQLYHMSVRFMKECPEPSSDSFFEWTRNDKPFWDYVYCVCAHHYKLHCFRSFEWNCTEAIAEG